MELTDKIAAERACERLVVDFAFFSDRQDYESLVELFAADGVMQRPNGDRLVGRDAILKAYQARPAGRMTRHVCTNIRISIESQDRARGFTYAVLYSGAATEPTKSQVGEFEDDFVRTPDGWRFQERRARFVM
jgi:ketosteroid isomerase-like protein